MNIQTIENIKMQSKISDYRSSDYNGYDDRSAFWKPWELVITLKSYHFD